MQQAGYTILHVSHIYVMYKTNGKNGAQTELNNIATCFLDRFFFRVTCHVRMAICRNVKNVQR